MGRVIIVIIIIIIIIIIMIIIITIIIIIIMIIIIIILFISNVNFIKIPSKNLFTNLHIIADQIFDENKTIMGS